MTIGEKLLFAGRSSIFFFVDVSSGFIYWLAIYELNLNFFIHTNLNFKMLSLQKWINNPHTHHWPHAKDQKFKGGQNFGSYTVIWDRLFGTFYLPENLSAPEEYGLVDNSNYPKGFISRFIHPFLK